MIKGFSQRRPGETELSLSKQNPKEKPKKKSSPLGCLSTLLVPLLCVVAVLCWKKDEVACHVLRGQLAKRFPEFRFDIGAVRLESSGASVSRLNVFLPAQGGFPETPLFGAEEIRVEVPLSISTILEKKFVPRHVLISRPTRRVQFQRHLGGGRRAVEGGGAGQDSVRAGRYPRRERRDHAAGQE